MDSPFRLHPISSPSVFNTSLWSNELYVETKIIMQMTDGTLASAMVAGIKVVTREGNEGLAAS